MSKAEGEKAYQAGNFLEATDLFRQAVEAGDQACLNQLGLAFMGQKEYAKAVIEFRKAVLFDPLDPFSSYNLALGLKNQGQYNEALRWAKQALALKPDWATAWLNLANIYSEKGEYPQALGAIIKALELDPANPDFRNNIGLLLDEMNDGEGARYWFSLALALDANHAPAHLNLAHSLLRDGLWEKGFAEYEWRFAAISRNYAAYPWPLWQGEDISGKRLLLTAEQGFGDLFQFVRYVPFLLAKEIRLGLLVDKAALRLMSLSFPGVEVITYGQQGAFDYHLPLLSLPRFVNIEAGEVPYLKVGPDWGNWKTDSGSRNIGLVWHSTKGYLPARSLDGNWFQLWADIPGIKWYSLQKETRAAGNLALPAFDWGERLEDFAQTAAAISQLDLVITTDTSVAHLAGALGKPCWTLLHHFPDWRWGRKKSDTFWYPTMRLWRQDSPSDWGTVLQRIRAELLKSS